MVTAGAVREPPLHLALTAAPHQTNRPVIPAFAGVQKPDVLSAGQPATDPIHVFLAAASHPPGRTPTGYNGLHSERRTCRHRVRERPVSGPGFAATTETRRHSKRQLQNQQAPEPRPPKTGAPDPHGLPGDVNPPASTPSFRCGTRISCCYGLATFATLRRCGSSR